MQKLNVLVVADENSRVVNQIAKSPYLNKLYTNFETEFSVEIRFNTFKELAIKCKSLKIDIVFVGDEKLILQGIADVLKKNYVNCIALNSFWAKLVLSKDFARRMTAKYDIKTPEVLSYPSEFPIVVKADGFLEFADSLTEVIELRKKIYNFSPEIAKSITLERFIEGKEFEITTLFDGKNAYIFPFDNCANTKPLLEYNKKLEQMFRGEFSEFIGYITSRLIISKGTLYNLGFKLSFPETQVDLLYIFISAIYQKLDELGSYGNQ